MIMRVPDRCPVRLTMIAPMQRLAAMEIDDFTMDCALSLFLFLRVRVIRREAFKDRA